MIRLLDIVRYPDDDRSLFDGSDYGDPYDGDLRKNKNIDKE